MRSIRGAILFQQGHYREAAECFDFVREKSPLDPVVLFNLGVTYFHLRNYDKADAAFSTIESQFSRTHPGLAHRARQAKELTAQFRGEIE